MWLSSSELQHINLKLTAFNHKSFKEEITFISLLKTASNYTGNTAVGAGELEHSGQILQQNARQFSSYFQFSTITIHLTNIRIFIYSLQRV